jgi:hypothetical protein
MLCITVALFKDGWRQEKGYNASLGILGDICGVLFGVL